MLLNNKNVRFFTLLFLWLAVLFYMRPWDKLKGNLVIKQNIRSECYEIYGSNSLTQSFMVEEVFDSIDIYMENNNNIYEGECIAKIYDSVGRCIYEENIKKSELIQELYEIQLPDKIYADHESYKLELTAPSLNRANCMLLYASEEMVYQDGEMTFNGDIQNKTLCFSVYTVHKNVFAYIALFIFTVSAGAWWLNRNRSFIRKALIVLVGMGLAMLVVMAPMSMNDEEYHYNTAFILSNILMGQENVFDVPDAYCDFTGTVIHMNANTAFIRVKGKR